MSDVYRSYTEVELDGVTTQTDVAITVNGMDARTGIWTLYDQQLEPVEGVVYAMSMDTVRIQSNPPLSAGMYKLVGIA